MNFQFLDKSLKNPYLTNITIRKNGEPEKGVRFELLIPCDTYRIIHDPAGPP
jgi:hypothetical protein